MSKDEYFGKMAFETFYENDKSTWKMSTTWENLHETARFCWIAVGMALRQAEDPKSSQEKAYDVIYQEMGNRAYAQRFSEMLAKADLLK